MSPTKGAGRQLCRFPNVAELVKAAQFFLPLLSDYKFKFTHRSFLAEESSYLLRQVALKQILKDTLPGIPKLHKLQKGVQIQGTREA